MNFDDLVYYEAQQSSFPDINVDGYLADHLSSGDFIRARGLSITLEELNNEH